MNQIIKDCYKKSIELLINNSTKHGLLASSCSQRAEERNYLGIFARDSSISSIGMVISRDKRLVKTAQNSLKTLARFQASNGQIPNYVKPENNYVDFWKIGCIDATLWWLLAINFYDSFSGDKKLARSLNNKINKAILWLSCQEHNADGLVTQNEASDWADIMPRSGKVLYSNALWYAVKKVYKLKAAEFTKQNFNYLFHPYGKKPYEITRCSRSTLEEIKKREKKNYYLSFVNYLFWGNDFDVYGNSLSIIFGLADKKMADKIFSSLNKSKINSKLPVPVLFNPIKRNDKLWRDYMESHLQNFPYQYHNGGIWPFASCFSAMAYCKNNQKELALKELEKIACLNKTNNWQFNEWFQGKTGKPMGMAGQSWNAGAFLLSYHYLKNDFEF